MIYPRASIGTESENFGKASLKQVLSPDLHTLVSSRDNILVCFM
jgi:hypothetical protein